MSRKTTAALIAALGINFALAGGALMLANLNKPTEFDMDAMFDSAPVDLKEVAGKPVDLAGGDLVVPLKAAQLGGNTRITFSCAKLIPSGRDVHEGTWDQISGAVLYEPENQKLIAVEATFDTRSLRTDTQALTTTVTAKEKWFDIDNHPTARFSADTIQINNAASSPSTHDLIGTFTLNGITKPITIPAKLSFSGQSLVIDAEFTILRSDYDVDKRESSLAGSVGGIVSEVEDEVVLAVRVTASPDPNIVIAELAQQVELQQEQLRVAGIERQQLKGLARQIELLQEEISRLNAAPRPQTTDPSELPVVFTDYADGNDGPYPFDMVLVPGDIEKGIAPFYMASHEVTWGMFRKWMYSTDLENEGVPAAEIAKLIEEGLRPSPLYAEPFELIQVEDPDNPAIAMSMLTAKSYCRWLSEITGRTYRLPTIDEWRHAMKLGGGLPSDLDAYAWYEENLETDFLGKPLTGRVGSKKPNKLGLYDLFGNACEWVTGTGVDRVVVGGHYFLPKDRFSADWQAVEDIELWNEKHPQLPKGRFWISDFHFTGIRLICEPASVAANPPKEQPAD
ncbi:MAG: YceI family protein [Planctomycetota bacterium]